MSVGRGRPTSRAALVSSPASGLILRFSRRAPDTEAARALVVGALDDAFAWIRAASRRAPAPTVRVRRVRRRWVGELVGIPDDLAVGALRALQARLDTVGDSTVD